MKIFFHLVYGALIGGSLYLLFPLPAPAASKPVVSHDSAQLIIRRAANLGTGLTVQITIDGKPAGRLSIGHTYRGSLSPGTHTVSVLLLPNRLALQPTTTNLTVTPGHTYAFTVMWKGAEIILK
jgi:hypothetical protein